MGRGEVHHDLTLDRRTAIATIHSNDPTSNRIPSFPQKREWAAPEEAQCLEVKRGGSYLVHFDSQQSAINQNSKRYKSLGGVALLLSQQSLTTNSFQSFSPSLHGFHVPFFLCSYIFCGVVQATPFSFQTAFVVLDSSSLFSQVMTPQKCSADETQKCSTLKLQEWVGRSMQPEFQIPRELGSGILSAGLPLNSTSKIYMAKFAIPSLEKKMFANIFVQPG